MTSEMFFGFAISRRCTVVDLGKGSSLWAAFPDVSDKLIQPFEMVVISKKNVFTENLGSLGPLINSCRVSRSLRSLNTLLAM